MLGLFLLLPVLALYAQSLPDYSPGLLGLAMGAYGLTQAVLQVPFGRWSDRFGRKPLITIGLLLYALGSLLGAAAHTVSMLVVARAVQGSGAVSAAVTALVADLTRDEVRTRAMAFIGISIGLSFVAALILAPVLDTLIGVGGIFSLMCVLALVAIALLHVAVPREPAQGGGAEGREFSAMLEILRRPRLRPLYAGIFALHFIMTATFISVPQALVHSLGVPAGEHWKVYLGVFVVSVIGTIPLVLATERSGRGQGLLVVSVLLLGTAEAMLGVDHGHLWAMLASLTLFFAVFNYLEARLPALLTQSVPAADRGAALGVYATAQFLGAFAGGVTGGQLLGRFGLGGVFWGGAAMALAWALVAHRTGPAAAAAVSG